MRLGVSPVTSILTMFQSEVSSLYFPALEPWVVQSMWLLTSSSWFICTQMWDCPLHQPCLKSSPPSCPSLPLLPVWMNVSSLTPWLSVFHTVWFSVSSGCFLCLNLLLSLLWLCEEAQCVYLCLHLVQKFWLSFLNALSQCKTQIIIWEQKNNLLFFQPFILGNLSKNVINNNMELE